MSLGLKRCPFCFGGGCPELETQTDCGPENYVMCNVCGSQSGLYKTAQDAVDAWNRRDTEVYRLDR